MSQQWQPRQQREQSYEQPIEYDAYGNPINPTESKREKRRRDMVERVGRLHADTLERRDRVFHDLSDIFARTADELLPPPVFPTFDLSIPVGQLPPSLPFTDPVIPDMHPTPYLFALHRLSLQRANRLLAVRLFHSHQVGVARRLFDAEVERIEEEYEGATKGVVERLLEGVEERRKRLNEEKEGEGVSLDTFLDPQSRSHGTRRLRGGPNRMHTSRPHLPSPQSTDSVPSAPTSSAPPLDNTAITTLLGLGSIADPFNLASSLLPSSASGGPLLASLASGPSTTTTGAGKRKPGPRQQPGLPPAHFIVTSGSYNQFGKSLTGISGLRGEEIEGDLGECRRKRVRTATGGAGGGRRRNGD